MQSKKWKKEREKIEIIFLVFIFYFFNVLNKRKYKHNQSRKPHLWFISISTKKPKRKCSSTPNGSGKKVQTSKWDEINSKSNFFLFLKRRKKQTIAAFNFCLVHFFVLGCVGAAHFMWESKRNQKRKKLLPKQFCSTQISQSIYFMCRKKKKRKKS